MHTRTKNRFWEWRVAQEWTLEEVSDLTGMSVSALSRIERGERNVPPATRVRIARRLGVPVRVLFEIEEIPDEAVG